MSKKSGNRFRHAWNGLVDLCWHESHFRIHLIAAAIVIIFGFIVNLNLVEWILILICIGMVLTAEAMNSSIEKAVDLTSPDYNPLAGRIKDIAAAAVLICALISALCGLIIFLPKIF